jgi:hypothetical protein
LIDSLEEVTGIEIEAVEHQKTVEAARAGRITL